MFPRYTWSLDSRDKAVYLTFDDGPHPEVTPYVLDELRKYNARATFFCVGKNVVAHTETYKRILDEGHSVGNHTYNHLNGWKTPDDVYLKDVSEAANHIDSNLFRPPYGRIRLFQAKNLQAAMKGRMAKVIMWDVLSADFDPAVSPEKSLEFVVLGSGPGSIVVFHDSQKAFAKLSYVLPRALHHFSAEGFKFLPIERK